MSKNKNVIDNNPNESKKGMIIGIIFLIWFIGSIIAMFCLSKINTNYCIMIFGQYFLVFGILPLFGKAKNKIIALPFVLVGLACIIIPYLMTKPDINGIVVNWDTVIVTLFLIAFIVAGLFLVIMSVKKSKKQKKLCCKEVEATIIKYGTTYSHDDGTRLYYPIYIYEYNGKKYEVASELAKNVGKKQIGTLVKLKINPDNPEEFLDRGALIVPLFLGIMFLITSVPLIILVIHNASFIK